ncbi:hypothetical protein B4125_2452 [Bacillus paralicheniformis]|uniref:Uncharacterized protein n=1 Tax=Bacillus paralicheniformis TaxID=1648923 RepID=A0ABY3G1X7_9BACI|nr:hypothetical protein SC10_B2orf04282 [Bacillus paralicheniformis]OLG08271.1 hypothetical protein B4125_2452 [Bacillus paralicheniformis]TWJ74597.1 hypothetical protein CHCC20497_3682 [Bacillus paralicheniformis]TWL45511.1 hypothetical protein CHCC15381_2239 [Bacillus paralicheniformis]TWM02109.1 hypothetical protein CHCC15136_2963 [Bacillus paralicheniformis]
MTSSFSDPEDIDEADFVAFFVLADRVMERDAFFRSFQGVQMHEDFIIHYKRGVHRFPITD